MSNRIGINECKVIGTIAKDVEFSHDIFGEKFYKTEIDIVRRSGAIDHIPVIISERLTDIASLKGKTVEIKGQFRSKNLSNCKVSLYVFALELNDENVTVDDTNNEIVLEGFVCKPTLFKDFLDKGRVACDVHIAVNRQYNHSDYIPTVCWGRTANFAKKLEIGDHITIKGRIQHRDYHKRLEDETVEIRRCYEVSVISLVRHDDEDKECED